MALSVDRPIESILIMEIITTGQALLPDHSRPIDFHAMKKALDFVSSSEITKVNGVVEYIVH
jgi:hypothetical protein